MPRKKKKKRLKKHKAKAKDKDKNQNPRKEPRTFNYFDPEPEREPVESMVRRYVELVSRRKLKELAERPLPARMTESEIEEELKELLE